MTDAKRQNAPKSSGTAKPDGASDAAAKRTRKPIAPDARTVTVRAVKRSTWAMLAAALSGDTDAHGALFGSVPPAEPVKPVLSDDAKTDVNAVLAHVDALNAYSAEMAAYPAALDAFNTRNIARAELAKGIDAALNGIALRERKPKTDA